MKTCSECGKTARTTNKSELKVECSLCLNVYHSACVNIPDDKMQFIASMKNINWTCKDCFKQNDFQKQVLKKLSEIESFVKNNEKILKNHQSELDIVKKSLANVTASYTSYTPASATTEVNGNNKRPYSVVASSWSDNATPITRITTVANKKPRIDVKKKQTEQVLVIRPKQQSDNNDGEMLTGDNGVNGETNKTNVKDTIKRLLNPLTDPVKSIRTTSKGNVIVLCNDEQSVKEIRKTLEENSDNKYEVNEPKTSLPIFTVVGFDEEYSNVENFKTAAVTQNDDIFQTESPLNILDFKINKNGIRTVKIETDLKTFRRVMSNQRLRIGWNSCKVYEYVNVVRCYKCSEYGHIANDCTSKVDVCAKCAGNHKIQECTNENAQCVNCLKLNKDLKLNVDTNHTAFSIQCPVLQRKMKSRKERIRYKD